MKITIDYDKKTGEYVVYANVEWEDGVQYLVGFEDSSGEAFENNPRFCANDTDMECEIYQILSDEMAPGFALTNKKFRQYIKDSLLIVKVIPSKDLKIQFKKKSME